MPNMLALPLSVPPTEVASTWTRIKNFYFGGSNYININDDRSVQGLVDVSIPNVKNSYAEPAEFTYHNFENLIM